MTQTRDIQPALAHLEAALEASCASLVALEATQETMHEASTIRRQIGDAIGSLRLAIGELRALNDVETSTLAFGFVLGADPGWAGAQIRRREARQRQSSPRRTA